MAASAQTLGSIRGTLKAKSGEPGIALTVRLQDTPLGATTDNDGLFVIRNVAPGRYRLVVSGVGYKSVAHAVTVAAGRETRVDLTVADAAVDIAGVTVLGRSQTQEVNRQAFSVTAIDAKPLYNTTLNLADALDRVAGVRVRETGGVGSNFNLSLNGLSGSNVRFFLDGVPLEGFGTSFQINNIPINLAERVEVYKGVVPIWLGSDALGGAVNIVTGNRQRNYVDASYSYGSFNTHRTTINAAVTAKSGLTAQVSAFQNYSDNSYQVQVDAADINTGAYAPGAWVRRFHDTYHNETFIANVGVVGKRYADKLLLGVTLGKNYKEIQTGARQVSLFGAWHRRSTLLMPTFKYQKRDLVKGLDVTLNGNFNFGTEQNIDTVGGRYDWYGNFKRVSSTGGERARSLFKYRNNNGIATGMVNYRLGEHHNLALSNVFNSFDRVGADELNPTANTAPQLVQKNVLGGGYTYNVEEKWSATAFGKLLSLHTVSATRPQGATTSQLGYGAAATYFVTPTLQVKASYERANRLPEPIELLGDVENVEANPNLQPEQSHNFNVDVLYALNLSADDRLSLTGSFIFRNTTNFIYPRLNANQTRLVYDNYAGTRTRGPTLDVRYQHKNRLSLGANFTYQPQVNTQQYDPGFTGVSPVYLDQIPNTPFLFGNADASLLLPDVGGKGNNLNFGYNVLYVDRIYLYWPSLGNSKYDIPRQLGHNLSAAYSLQNGRYNIGLECRNVTNVLLYDNFSLQKPTRAFYVNLRYFFHKTSSL